MIIDMLNVAVFECSHDLDYGCSFANMAQESVAHAFAFMCTGNDTSDIEIFRVAGTIGAPSVKLAQLPKAIVWHRNDISFGSIVANG